MNFSLIQAELDQPPANCDEDDVIRSLVLATFFPVNKKGCLSFTALKTPQLFEESWLKSFVLAVRSRPRARISLLVDLLAKVEVKLQMESRPKHGCGLLRVYKVIDISKSKFLR